MKKSDKEDLEKRIKKYDIERTIFVDMDIDERRFKYDVTIKLGKKYDSFGIDKCSVGGWSYIAQFSDIEQRVEEMIEKIKKQISESEKEVFIHFKYGEKPPYDEKKISELKKKKIYLKEFRDRGFYEEKEHKIKEYIMDLIQKKWGEDDKISFEK